MKRIGIITVSKTNNFGAELQAFALHKKLSNLGFDSEIIDYLYFKNKRHHPSKKSKPEINFSKKQKIKEYILYRIVSPLIENWLTRVHKSTQKRLSNFQNFYQLNCSFSKEYNSIEKLYSAHHKYDVFIVGSDQVWNPATGTSLKPYFLDFAPKDKIKLSYASSFGISTIDYQHHKLYKKYLTKLDFISVREENGVKIIKQIAERNSLVVLDPTLLLTKEEWSDVSKNSDILLKNKYILIYSLHDSDSLIELAYKLSKQLDLPIMNLCKRSFINKKYKNITNITDAGPSEFISLFQTASFVLTNSFHGTVFSVNFNIPFYSVLKSNRSNNSRILDFLALVKLTGRICYEKQEICNNSDSGLISFDVSNQILLKEKVRSLDFLINAINSDSKL